MLMAEIKKIIRTLAYILFVVVMVGTYITQMLPEVNKTITKPEPGLEYYGAMEVEMPSVLLPAATESLIGEYLAGYYTAYPLLFYKEVHLKSEDEEKMAEIIEQLTGLSKKELDDFTGYVRGGYSASLDENGNQVIGYKEAVLPGYELNQDVTYEEFKELMRQADEIIGGGSKYAEKNLVSNFSNIPMTYEDAIKEYEQIVTGENLGKAYTRLFCDYMGIFLAIIAIFAAASFWNMDRNAKVMDLIYSRDISSLKIVAVRLLALFIAMLPAVLLPYLHMLIKVSSLYDGIHVDWGMAVLEMLLWLLPEMLFVTVLSALITEIISPILSIFVQGVWWYMALETNDLVGDINKWTLIIRHNSLGDIAIWESEWESFVWNRMCYFCLSIILLVCLIIFYDLKRKGRIRFGFKGRKRNYHKKSLAVL